MDCAKTVLPQKFVFVVADLKGSRRVSGNIVKLEVSWNFGLKEERHVLMPTWQVPILAKQPILTSQRVLFSFA